MDNDLKKYIETLGVAWECYTKKEERLDRLEEMLSDMRQGNLVLGGRHRIEIQSERELLALIYMHTTKLEEMAESIEEYVFAKIEQLKK